jgi:aspartate racemase
VKQLRTIGVIGGMGPAATADFLARLVRGVPAADDRDHPRILVDSNPHVPDRNAALAGTGPSPGPSLARMAQGLEAQGAELLAMPCNAAHGWAADIRAATALPFIDMIEASVARLEGARTVGLIAVAATLDARLYHCPLEAAGVRVIEPDRAAVARLVARVKAGDVGPEARAAAEALAAELVARGADHLLAACTEIPLVLGQVQCHVPLVETTQALADATLEAAAA